MRASLLAHVLSRGMVAGTPLLLGSLGEILAERSGVLNLGVEGMMALGAAAAFIAARASGSPWVGLAAGVSAAAALALLHALASVTLKANQILSGLALSMLGLGLSGVWGRPYVGQPLSARLEPLGRGVFSGVDALVPVSLAAAAAVGFLLFRTRWGLVIRSVGENPAAADAAGIGVSRVRFLCVLAGGAFAGAAGSHLSLAVLPAWIEGMTAGRGWIVVALTVFSSWRPGRAAAGALLFGAIESAQYLLQDWLSPNLLNMLPYLATLLALAAALRRRGALDGPPAALSAPYFKEDR